MVGLKNNLRGDQMFRFALYLCLCSQVVTCASSLSANQRDLCGNAMIVRNSNEIVKNDQGELVVGLDQLGDDSFLVPPGKQLVGESDSSFKLREFKFRGYTRAKFVMVMAQSLQNESFFGVLKPNGTVVNDLESFAEGMIPWHHFNSETISEIDRRLKNDFPYEWYAVPREIAAKRSIETLEAYVNAASIYGFEKPGIILGPSYRGEGRPSLEQQN
ncbi:MAG: hypothetical protein NTV34_15130 [Proteobacteria bacterium]|nr:hypothetical protein [Pseudomonadota bacterium]